MTFHMDPIGDTELKELEKRMREIMKQNHYQLSREEHQNESLERYV